jgi:uncharacterized protein YdcH (DUF465 family)/uncharacterized cupin superfamily protein
MSHAVTGRVFGVSAGRDSREQERDLADASGCGVLDLRQSRTAHGGSESILPEARGAQPMDTEHHRDLAHEFPELKHRVHELKLASAQFRSLYEEYRSVDNEICRIEEQIETPSDDYVEELKRRRVHLKDRLYGMLTGRLPIEAPSDEYVRRDRFRRPVDHGEVARGWVERGFSCRAFTDPPGQVWRNYVHDTNELVTVVEGRLEVELHDQSYVLEPGDELYIPRGAKHTVRNLHTGSTRWLYGYD